LKPGSENRQILGVNFYVGDVNGAIRRMCEGGLLVVPAAPALKDLARNGSYREALLNADVAITDSAFMVMIWNLLEHDSIRRVSGLEYLTQLLLLPEVRQPGNTFWVMAGPQSANRNLAWLSLRGIEVSDSCVYEAPKYGAQIDDAELKRHLGYRPAIHCIGAAIAFLSGDQVRIPMWADRLYLGWLFRCFSAPVRYIPRYWSARKLLPLMIRYRSQLPAIELPMRNETSEAA
jgi:N-acetylglucosaminyldiphosphoundecaprenol N-acetyl-beta-D-mannosaminyltransferase